MARRLFHPDVPAAEVRRLFAGLTPARLVEVMAELDVLEMMLALRKMRLRNRVANQAHVTNLRDHPALLAADAAEAALRGFAEVETTVGVAGMAPLNAVAILVGSQVGRPGVLTQAAVEEGVNLRLAMKGLVSYAETLSVYGDDESFRDGDDTPWSKAFLASAYASRGVKVRFTSGSGSEVLLGHARGHSMLYLEARCILLVKGAGSQGVQNGAISCIALPLSLPGGIRGVLAENLIAASVGLEVASGNDAMASHSEMRKTAKLMLQLIPGTDFVTSGYSVMPRQDNLFGGGNFDANDLDAWALVQRDLGLDGGITPASEDEVRRVRRRAALAVQAVWAEMGLPAIGDREVDAAVDARDSGDLPARSRSDDVAAARRFLDSPANVLDVAGALVAHRLRTGGRGARRSRAPARGGRLPPARGDPRPGRRRPRGRQRGERRSCLQRSRHRLSRRGRAAPGDRKRAVRPGPPRSRPRRRRASDIFEEGPAAAPGRGIEVVVAVGPAFGVRLGATLAGLSHRDVVLGLLEGIREERVSARVVRVRDTADCAFIGHEGARLSGSGVAIGIQSRGTAVIHRKDLAPLDNLELLSHAPNLTLDSYRALGRNAACYALGKPTEPVPVRVDNMARLKHIVHSTLLHRVEVEAAIAGAPAVELTLREASAPPGGARSDRGGA